MFSQQFFYSLFFSHFFIHRRERHRGRDRHEATVQLCGLLWYSADMGSIRRVWRGRGWGVGGLGKRMHNRTGREKKERSVGLKISEGNPALAERLYSRHEAAEKKRIYSREEQRLERW